MNEWNTEKLGVKAVHQNGMDFGIKLESFDMDADLINRFETLGSVLFYTDEKTRDAILHKLSWE